MVSPESSVAGQAESSPSLTLDVALGERSYPIHIGSGLLANAGDLLATHIPGGRAIIIADSNTGPLYAEQVADALKLNTDVLTLPAGEETKSYGVLVHLLDDLLALQPDRKTTLIALGGGVIGDITGFAASILLRGVPFIQIPTTLLAQVDSSVGGKTAINSPHGKNLIGTFYQPQAVLIDVDTLRTLPPREMRAGYAEVLKYGLLGDRHFYHWLEEHGEALIKGDQALQMQAVEISCRAKAAIVAEDEREKGARALLNLGHTFGHALEKATGYSDMLLHGEAVAIGCLMACDLSVRKGVCPEEDLVRLRTHLDAMGLLPDLHAMPVKWDARILAQYCYQDKKAEAGGLTFILMRGIGDAFITREVQEDEAAAVFASYVS